MIEELMPFVEALGVLRVTCAELQAVIARGEIQLFCYEGVNMFRREDILELRNRINSTGELVGQRIRLPS